MNCWKWIDASMLLSLVKMHMIIICKHCVDCVTCLTGQRRLVWTSWQNTGQERSRREWRFLWGHCCLWSQWQHVDLSSLLLLFLLDAVVVASAPSEVIWLILNTSSCSAALLLTLDTYCCHMDTAINHPLPDRVKSSFVILDIQALWRSGLSDRVPVCQTLQMKV